ncbi:hypothetical protein COBT_000040 [Conglomerata obtusa]
MIMLILSRGCSAQSKNILKDLNKLVPSTLEHKHDQKNSFTTLVELMEMNECNSTIYIETTKRVQYAWIAHENGPSVRFKSYNQFTMQELSFPVNCSKLAGHRLFFDTQFGSGELNVVKNLFTAVFGESEVFDRVLAFFYVDGKVWMRVYAIEDGLKEIGPRIVLEIDKILEGCFKGKILYKKGEKEAVELNEDKKIDDNEGVQIDANVGVKIDAVETEKIKVDIE